MALLVPRMYSGFRGVDFRGEECELFRSPDSLNMWRDYKETESIRTRPRWKKHCFLKIFAEPTKTAIYGMYFYHDTLFAHANDGIYKVIGDESERVTIQYSYGVDDLVVNKRKSHGFVYEDKLYIMDGARYLRYDGETWEILYDSYNDHCYVPTTSIGRKPAGGGTPYEDVNLLSDYRINTFIGDGESKEYYLDAQNIDSVFEPQVTINGTRVGMFSVDHEEGRIRFSDPPDPPITPGQDNVVIKFKKKVDGYVERILDCTLSQVFDNRVFVSGNPRYPNMVWHCSLNDPTYFSDLDYYREGLDDAKITGMVAGNNALWVFREPSDANTTVFYHTPTIDDQYGKIYPSTHSSVSLGCVGAAINFNDDIVFFSQRGMEGISGDITTEQVAAHRSSLVDSKLLSEKNYKNMILAEWEGYLMVFIGSRVYLADSRTAFQYENHIEYEWFYWDYSEILADYSQPSAEIFVKVHDGVLYLGRGRYIYTLSDYDCGVTSYWVTPKDKFQYPHKLKTTSKRGCVVEATGDVAVYAKTEKTDFELIGEYKDVEDYFVSRIKMKKFKDLQLEFYSDYRFSLESATMECFVGGYIKR